MFDIQIVYSAGYLKLLSQLTQVGEYSKEIFDARFDAISVRSDAYKIVVIEGTCYKQRMNRLKIGGIRDMRREKRYVHQYG